MNHGVPIAILIWRQNSESAIRAPIATCVPSATIFPSNAQVVANPALATYGTLPRNQTEKDVHCFVSESRSTGLNIAVTAGPINKIELCFGRDRQLGF